MSEHLLDAVVRDTVPPLAWLGGGPYFALTMVVMQVGHFWLLNHYGVLGFLVYLLLAASMFTLDGFVSNSFGHNVRVLRANGFSDATIVGTMAFNTVFSQIITLVVIHYIGNPAAMADLLRLESYSVATVTCILVNLALSEVFFYAAHKVLHESWPSIHVMHHCCKSSSHATNVIFHPVDLAFEFGGPGGVVLALHYLLWDQNLTVLLATYIFIQTYYAIDHNEWLRTYHYKHHAQIDAVYTIYVSHRADPRKDLVRHLVVKPKSN
ncbi:hypothetical protein ACHHYP_05121 [Achlya hypogyna]|uniref:Fatty acid hydroxylase domain-containing protein n=1 Tax=Achlya hypogyna TaxID=1202772 RepID=A0A1V9YZ63_ACHHY|nr:hypothetical protein ACHHYP_05121 [Achlya hypogyna]